MAAVAPEPPSPEHAHVHFSADTGQPAERTDKHEQLMRRYGSAEASNETEAFFSRAWDAVTRSTNALTVGGDKKAENGDDDNTIMKFLAETTKAMRGGLNKLRGARRILSIPALRAGLSAEQRMERAALFVCDAQNQRYAHGLGVAYQDSRVKFRLLQMRDSKLYSFVMYMVIVLYCILGAMALPPEHRPGGRAPNRWPHDTQLALNVLNVACAALVLADSLLRAYVWGALTGTLTDASSIFPIALNCLLLADTLVAVIDNHRGWPVVRACRALLLFRSHILKTLMITLLATVPAALLIGVFIFTLMLLYSILAIQFYAGAYSGPDNFDRIGAALRTFFVLLYTDNYPSVVNSAANRHGYFAWLFFMSFLVAGTIVSFNVVLSIMVPLYKENHTKTAVAAKILERKALTAAFGLLEDGTGVVTRMQWRRLVPLVEHGISAKRIEMLFDLADQDGSGEINIVEFFEIVTTLSHPAELEKLDPVTHVFFIPQWLQERAKQVITNRYVRRAIAMLLVANTIVFCLYGTVSDTRGLTRAWRVFLGIFSAEVCLKIMAAPRLFWTDNWCVFDFVAVLVLGLGAQIAYAIVLRVDASDNVTDIVRRFASGAGAIRLFRLLDMIPPFRALTHTLLRVVFTLGRFVAIFLIIFYVFAVIGQDLFAYKFCNSDGECMRWSNLDTVWNGTLLLFQVLLLAGWSDFMYMLMASTNVYASWFFILYILLANAVVFNTFVATLVDSFSDQFDVSKVTFGRDKFKEMVNALVEIKENEAVAAGGAGADSAKAHAGRASKSSSSSVDGDVDKELKAAGLDPDRLAAARLTKYDPPSDEADAPATIGALVPPARSTVVSQLSSAAINGDLAQVRKMLIEAESLASARGHSHVARYLAAVRGSE